MIIEYKCRRCGVIHTPIGGNINTIFECLSHLIMGTPYQPLIGRSPTLLGLHVCEDKGLGISDIIGAKRDSYETK